MAKRNTTGRSRKRKPAKTARKAANARPRAGRKTRSSATRQAKQKPRAAVARKKSKRPSAKRTARRAAAPGTRRPPAHIPPPRLARERRVLVDEGVPTPPSSLNMDRHGSAARTGRAGMAETRANHASMSPAISAGDADVQLETAYFSGDEAPGGDNQTPDQDVVDEIGRALGVEYQDNEELRANEKVADRDRHRWELDPASAEDYKER
jgi:hypothetical protein